MTKPSTAIMPASLDNAELMALLGQAGMTPKAANTFRRMTLTSGSLITDAGQPDEEAWPPTKRGPTMVVRIVRPPIFYNAFWLGTELDDRGNPTGGFDPNRINRPDLNKTYAKKYDDPSDQANDEFAHTDAYEAIERLTGKRGSFKADIQLQIVPDSGTLTGDEPVYTLSLSQTSAFDWRGSSKNPYGGVVQEKNFIVQLAELARAQAIEAGGDKDAQTLAVLEAMTSLALGNVIAEIYLIQSSNEDKSRVWTVVAFKPIHIAETVVNEAIEAGTTTDVVTNSDDIPF